MHSKEEIQNKYRDDIISAFFKAGEDKNYKMINLLLQMQGISLNMINNQGKSFIATWCEKNNLWSSTELEQMENWIASGQIDFTFKFQGKDIISWCISPVKYSYAPERYLSLAKKIILFLPLNKELIRQYNTLLPDTVRSESTLSLTETLLSLPDIDIQQVGSNNQDAFQTALEVKNYKAITILGKRLALFRGQEEPLIKNNVSHLTLEVLKEMIARCYSLFFDNKINELEELMVRINIQLLHLLDEKGEYPSNFSDLLFELSNNLATIQDGNFESLAYDLRKAAADLGHERAQAIVENFSHKKPEPAEKTSFQPKIQDEIKSFKDSSSFQEARSSFFHRFKHKQKGKTLNNNFQNDMTI